MAVAIPDNTIRAKMREVLLTVSGLPVAARRAWENRSFVPPNPPATWIRETYLPGFTTIESNGLYEMTAIMQYDVFVPRGSGSESAETLTNAIKETYESSPSIAVGNGHFIRVDNAGRLPAFPEETVWTGYAVQVAFHVYGTRPSV